MLMSSKWNLGCGGGAGEGWLRPWDCPSSVTMGVLVTVGGVVGRAMGSKFWCKQKKNFTDYLNREKR